MENINVTMVEKEIIHVTMSGTNIFPHNHDDRYYTQTQMDTKLAQKVSGYFDPDFRAVINEF